MAYLLVVAANIAGIGHAGDYVRGNEATHKAVNRCFWLRWRRLFLPRGHQTCSDLSKAEAQRDRSAISLSSRPTGPANARPMTGSARARTHGHREWFGEGWSPAGAPEF